MIKRSSIITLLGAWLVFLGYIEQTGGQIPLEIRTRYLSLEFAPASGGLKIRILNRAGRSDHIAEAPGLFLDNLPQLNFTVIRHEPPLLENESLTVSFEILDERAIAVNWTARDQKVHEFELHLRSDDQTGYYGTGERFNALNQRGYLLPLKTDDRFGNKGTGSHKPLPFFMSSRGFGIWVDSYVPGIFDLNASERFISMLRFPETSLRVVFIAGPEFADILETFTGLTGRSPVPPAWAFALWKSRDVHHNQDSVLVDIEKLRLFNIPASVLVIDSPWETGYNNFEINRQQFPDPESMFKRIEELGFYLCLWLTPFVNKHNVIDMPGIAPASSNYPEAAGKGILVRDKTGNAALSKWWKGEGGLVDFTNPQAVEWWHQQLLKTRAYGARAFKCDDGEGNFVPDAVFHDGSPVQKMKNRYAVLYDSIMQAYVDKYLGGEGVLITRSGYTGCQRFPFAWAGDNQANFSFGDGLPSVILAGQNAALSGISLWGSDIAGYVGKPDKELFIRWTQFSTFTPFMQIHMTSNLGPWDFDTEVLDIFRFYAKLRMQLFPYLYNAVYETARSGLPVIRPMALAFQNDREAQYHIYQYLFGADILVAPLYQSGRHRAVYLPRGAWVDYWNGNILRGPQTLEVEAPLEKIPLFVRAGAIIPMLPEDVQTLIPRHEKMHEEIIAIDNRRILQIWPGDSGAVETWEGLSAKLHQQTGRTHLMVSSITARPLEIHLMYRRVDDLAVQNGASHYDEKRQCTVISYPEFVGEQMLDWRE